MSHAMTKKMIITAAVCDFTSLAAINGVAAQSSGRSGGGTSAGDSSEASGSGNGKIASLQPVGITGFSNASGTPPDRGRRPTRPQPVSFQATDGVHCGYREVGRGRNAIYLRYCGETLYD
ncbi:hypothetical protein [Breoghania sp.]|uniref:hypothetical protein n=1 Tax=Breoghania sp. TaxID=2065378 RepID=UPI0026077D54|nr:hypothetical protein [Breoghania sp.]MDJ0930320.1 hypothetical protein [Breoghania sp.]